MSMTFDQAIDRVLDQRRTRQDVEIPIKNFSLSLDSNGENIVGTIDGRDYAPTEHCLRQMATWMGVSHAVLRQYTSPVVNQNGTVRYNRDEKDRELLVALFKNGIRDGRINPDKTFKFRTYTDGTLRAMLSDRYAIIDNVWYLEQLKNICQDAGCNNPVFEHFNGDADTIYANLRLPDVTKTGPDSDYGGMISVGNCEIGKRRISLAPAVWRQICTNGMMGWMADRDQMWSKVHRGSVDLNGLASDIRNNILQTIPMLEEGIDTLLAARQRNLTAQPSEVIAQIAETYKLSNGLKGQAVETVEKFVNHESNSRNMFGIVNAITRVAQTQTPDEQVRLEGIGGNIVGLSDTGWDRLNTLAQNMSEEKRNKIFGVVSA